MTVTPAAAILIGLAAVAAFALAPWLGIVLLLVTVALALVDALSVRRPPRVERRIQHVLARGVPAPLEVDVEPEEADAARRVVVRQPALPDVRLAPARADGARLRSSVTVRRRGRHLLPPPAVRTTGPLALGAWTHSGGEPAELLVYPDITEADRLARAVRQARFRDAGERRRGPLGLGTEFESIRDYLPDDDVRQVNWRATARVGRPMSNQYRVEQDRDVICLVDAGRLMGAPLGELTRLDAALDALVAVAAVADVMNDRTGAIAFDAELLRSVAPRRRGARAIVRSIFDLEPSQRESDYELAFRAVEGSKRAFVLVLTDLLEPVAAQPLVSAMPILGRRHSVVVASARDTDLDALLRRTPRDVADVAAASVAADVLEARRLVAARLRRAGAQVVEAAPASLAVACVGAYLRSKARAAF